MSVRRCEETCLVFERRYAVPKLEIRAANTGERACFHGIYPCGGDLDAGERKAVIEADGVK